VFIPRLGTRHYTVRYGTPLLLAREARDAYSLDRAMRTVVADFENIIRTFPTQWFQFLPFWPAAAAAKEQTEAAASEPSDDRGEQELPLRRGAPR
jgi:predicted LPLAT superfamily acyltransferase